MDRGASDVYKRQAYAYDQGQNGPIFTGIDEYKVPIIDMFLFLYDQYEEGYVTLDADMDEKLTDLYNTLHDAQLQLQGEDYSRLVLTVSVPTEGDEAYTAMDDIRNICAKYYNKSDVILVGDCTSNHDLMSSFATDNIIISVLTCLLYTSIPEALNPASSLEEISMKENYHEKPGKMCIRDRQQPLCLVRKAFRWERVL